MIKKRFVSLYADNNLIYFNENSGDFIFSCNEMVILSIDLSNINFDNSNYSEDDPETIIHVRLLAWYSKFEKLRTLKKELNEELMHISWHPRRLWNFACQKIKTK